MKRWRVQPPRWFRALCPGALWRLASCGRRVYLTFDDGPVEGVTDRVLDILAAEGVKATFFMVGDNARRNPQLLQRVKAEGHLVGNHTMHHLRGSKTACTRYVADVAEANALLRSRLFRPPHGWLSWRQACRLRRDFTLVMYDVVTRDYARDITPEEVADNVRRYTRDGSVIVFHDSERSAATTLKALPMAIVWLKTQGYDFALLPH